MSFPSSQGTTFSFGSWTGKCMSIQVSDTAPEPENQSDPTANRIDVSTLDLAHGSEKVFLPEPLVTPTAATDDDNPIVTTTVTITFRGDTKPPAGTTNTLSTADASGDFFCSESTITRQTNAYVEGTAKFVSVAE